jgi:hypothetical protein
MSEKNECRTWASYLMPPDAFDSLDQARIYAPPRKGLAGVGRPVGECNQIPIDHPTPTPLR